MKGNYLLFLLLLSLAIFFFLCFKPHGIQIPSCCITDHLPRSPIFQDICAWSMHYTHTTIAKNLGSLSIWYFVLTVVNTFLGNIWLLDPFLSGNWFFGTHLSTRDIWIILHKCIILTCPHQSLSVNFLPTHISSWNVLIRLYFTTQ